MTDSRRVELAKEGKLRLDCRVTDNTDAALSMVQADRKVSRDEASRVLVGLGDFLYEAAKNGQTILLLRRDKDGQLHQITLL